MSKYKPMPDKVVIYSLTWIGNEIIGQPKPVLLAAPAAKNVLKNVSKEAPAWIEEKDLSRYGFEVEKKSATQQKTAPAVKQSKAPKPEPEQVEPQKLSIKSVEQVEEEAKADKQ